MTRARWTAAIAGMSLLLASCSRNEPLSLHGAGSMRVQIEVYKGPLSVSTAAQIGQLAAVIAETVRAVSNWHEEAELLYGTPNRCQYYDTPEQRKRMVMPGWRDCDMLASTRKASEQVLGAACYIINTPAFSKLKGATYLPIETCKSHREYWRHLFKPDPTELMAAKRKDKLTGSKKVEEVEKGQMLYERLGKDFEHCEKILSPVGAFSSVEGSLSCYHEAVIIALNNLASLMRGSAFRAVDGQVRYVPGDDEIRSLITSYGYISSEFGNQIAARTAVLEKQLKENKDARLLPTSDYLRDSSRTDFIHLFDWLDADRSYGGEASKLRIDERIRMAEQLTSDYYWAKVNEVYASGQGNVSMAFIKDELGNWNLKSFSNDPSELLRSYRRVTDAAFKSAASLLGGAGGGAAQATRRLGLAERAASLANRLAGGEVPSNQGADVAAMHARVAARLADRATRLKALQVSLRQEANTQGTAVATLTAQVANAQNAVNTANNNLQTTPTDPALIEALKNAQGQLIQLQQQRGDAEVALKAANRRLEDLPKEATAAFRDILDDYLASLAEKQASIAEASAPAGETSP